MAKTFGQKVTTENDKQMIYQQKLIKKAIDKQG